MESAEGSEGQKVATILSKAEKEILDPKFPENKDYILQYGSKKLTVAFSVTHGIIITHLINIADDDAREERETYLLHVAAHRLMQEFVDTLGKPLRYVFTTSNEKIARWAETAGEQIFHWSKTSMQQGDDGNKYSFHSQIEPKKS